MKTTLTRESPSRLKVSIEATPDEVAPAIERAVRKLAGEVKIPGFRKGHVPRKVLETRLGRDTLREATLREAIPELLSKMVEEETLAPVAPPSVDVTSYDLDSDLSFDATVEVRPDIELPDFSLLSATKPSSKATPQEIEEQLERVQERFASLETVERPIRRGDYALINITTTIHDAELKELSGTDQLYEVGSGFPVPELDDEIENLKMGEMAKFNAKIPEAMQVEHAGEEATFQILVKEVRQKKVPPLDDDFAKTASEFETLDELRADLAERIEKVKAVQADADVRTKIIEQVLEDVEVEPPKSMVDDEMAFRLQRFDEQLRSAGMTLDAYMQSQGVTEEQLESDLRTQAERNVRAQLILEEVGKKEGFTVTEEELREEIRYHAEATRTDPNELAKQLQDRNRLLSLAGDIIRRKALTHLVEKAEISSEDGEASEQEPKEGE